MNPVSVDFLGLMFDKGHTVCLSDSQYAYHSVPMERVLDDKITLLSPNSSVGIKTVPLSDIILVALNPIRGNRNDDNCYEYRNFMLEIDVGTLESQIEYIKAIGIPTSAMVFSGGKSVHCLIALDVSLPSEKAYRYIAQWILNIATLGDPNCKNPSRCIRLPGSIRKETGKEQSLIEMGRKITLIELKNWLSQYPHAKPPKERKRERSEVPTFEDLSPWAKKQLASGTVGSKNGRNKDWFAIACEFALSGYAEYDTLDLLGAYFSPERDFKEREWRGAIKSAFKYVNNKK